MAHLPALQLTVKFAEYFAAAAGVGVWWHFQFRRSTSAFRIARLAPWNIPTAAFLLLCVCVIAGGLSGGATMQLALSFLPAAVKPDTEFATMLVNLGLHLGVFAGVLIGRALPRDLPPEVPPVTAAPLLPPLSTQAAIGAGFLTFLALLPLVVAVSWIWQTALETCGIPTEKQDLLELFRKTHGSGKLTLMIAMAILLAPLTEELTFRAGIFRFLRDRIPWYWAYILPAALFAALHQNLSVFAPLFTLGLFFSLVYRRTGRILVTMIAHGLFNLNTVIVVLLGLNI